MSPKIMPSCPFIVCVHCLCCPKIMFNACEIQIVINQWNTMWDIWRRRLSYNARRKQQALLFSWKLDLFENQMGGDMERMCLAGGTGVIQALSMYCDRVHFYHPISTSDQFLLNKLNLLGSGYTPPDTSSRASVDWRVRWGRVRTSVRTGRRGRDCLVPTPIQFRFVEICTNIISSNILLGCNCQ